MKKMGKFCTAVIGRGLGQPSANEKNECFNQKGLNSNVWQLFIPDLHVTGSKLLSRENKASLFFCSVSLHSAEEG